MTSSISRLRELVADPGRLTPQRLWRALSTEDRRSAVASFLKAGIGERGNLVSALARSRSFRAKTVQRWTDDKLAHASGQMFPESRELVMELLYALHVPGRCQMVGTFLEGLEVPHECGVVDNEVMDALEPSLEAVRGSAAATISEHGEEQFLTYIATLVLQGVRFSPVLTAWLGENSGSAGTMGPSEGSQLDVEPFGEFVEPEVVEGLTTLDKQTIFSIVDAAQGIDGALDEDEVDDLVEQLLHLSGRRHQSYFHAGLRDVLFGREPSGGFREKNTSRARWYWAGVVQGYARARRWPAIIDTYDAQEIVRTLGDGSDGASEAAIVHVAMALRELQRGAEIGTFVSRPALVRWPTLLTILLQHGTILLRADRAPEAKDIFDLLASTIDELAESDVLPDWPLFLEVKRRQAHCVRQVGEFARARSLLLELLDQDPDPALRAMTLADLGLLDGGFRRLSDVQLPDSREDLDIVADALSEGASRFREAVEVESRYSSHGHYCLGILALSEPDFESAQNHFQYARAGFRANPRRYESGALLQRVDLYSGIALVHTLQAERMSHGATLISVGLKGGVPFPPYLLRTTLEHLSLGRSQDLEGVIESLLEHCPDQCLSDLATFDLQVRSTGIADALLARAHDPDSTRVQQSSDLRAALPHLSALNRVDDLGHTLDSLEALALEGAGAPEFIVLLTDSQSYDLVWGNEDALVAQAHVHQSRGDYAQASTILADLFHRTLAKEERDAVDAAMGILTVIHSFGVGAATTDPLERRLSAFEAYSVVDDTAQVDAPPGRVRVLMVGGDERQQRQEEVLRGELGRRAPHIEISFLRTGWTSNWNRHVDEFKRRHEQVDAVVFMRFMRTEFGRQVRRICEVPWRFCWGAGRDTAYRAILAAAQAGQQAMDRPKT
jgi:tetratricopeptide (TPR) repeat protein